MSKKSEYVSLSIILALAFVLITHSQFKIDTLYSYDAYFQNGISRIILDSGDVVYDVLEPPYAASSTVVTIGYVPMPPISQTILSLVTSSSLFFAAKIYIITFFFMLILTIYILTKKITKSPVASIFSSFVFIFIPIVFYRLNYIVGESSALLLWLLIFFILINQKATMLNISLVPLFVAGLTFHPRSLIFYLPLMIILYLLKNGFSKNNINIRNLVIVLSITIIAIPFLKFFILNLLAYSKQGATYILFPPITVQPITFDFISSQFGIFVLLISFFGLIYLFKNIKKFEYQFLSVWLLLGWMLIFVGFYLSFPSNRLTLHLGVILALLCGCVLQLVKNNSQRIMIPFILFLLIVPVVPIFNKSSWHNPFLGWGNEEKKAMMFLSSNIVEKEHEEDYLIFTSAYSLPFGYGLKHIEFNETLLAEILSSSTEQDLLLKFNQKYPSKKVVYIIKENYANKIISNRFPILKNLDDGKIIYSSSKVQIYRYPIKGIET
ncbi:hypothetical protein [Candidatus Methanoperedens nitratireducens]|uniref:Uncharacterized protein n=1 Tax=Candidatus Methanoperedens nitratireducens TaxID=1392998 RepID=A0A284VUS6_9EURY|nr:hypothetical protein [Candidatus Methanoperedens nitroreducens]SNQ62933.1 membrane hypothetical protein [Candidatus Methanoperedens nitroreducens]